MYARILSSQLARAAQTILAPQRRNAARTIGPDFVCIGVQKGGTGWLYGQLRSHPDFWMPPIKELHYFDQAGAPRCLKRAEQLRNRGGWSKADSRFLQTAIRIRSRPMNLDEYASLFASKGSRLSGDITPAYSTLGNAEIEAIASHFPMLRVVLIARDPIARFWSSFSMKMRSQRLSPFAEDDWDRVHAHLTDPGVRNRSYPSQIADRWRRFIPDDRFGLYFLDDVAARPAALRSRIIEFIGGDPRRPSGDLDPSFNAKAKKLKQPMSDVVRQRLIEHFAGELYACAGMFGGPAEEWPKKYGL